MQTKTMLFCIQIVVFHSATNIFLQMLALQFAVMLRVIFWRNVILATRDEVLYFTNSSFIAL